MSKDQDIIQVWSDTQGKSVVLDQLLVSSKSLIEASRQLKDKHSNAALNHLHSLTLQEACSKVLNETVPKKNISLWSATMEQGTNTIYNFAFKAFL